FQSAELLEAMQSDLAAQGGAALTELRVDGGATANDLLMQFQADLLGVPVLRPQVLETTALGAAYLAGLAVGLWAAPADVERAWRVQRMFEPGISADERAERMARWREAVQRAKGWA
ncbi:MAG: FGGY-family carbohydrate kinase, partial [Negativicutes bacterium]|nr:FGGY-family carbohydrate kinase [Negativicutes bacterium]